MRKLIRIQQGFAHPLAMLFVGMTFIVIGIVEYPAYIAVGVFYIIIALRVFHMLSDQ